MFSGRLQTGTQSEAANPDAKGIQLQTTFISLSTTALLCKDKR